MFCTQVTENWAGAGNEYTQLAVGHGVQLQTLILIWYATIKLHH